MTQRLVEFTTTSGVIRGFETGADCPRKILAVHGWLDNAASFLPIAPLIDDAHLVMIDLPGHGHSDYRPPGVRYYLVDYLFEIVEVLDQLGWQKFNLLGHSLGAGILTLLAAAMPDRIHSLCLIDGIGPISGREEDASARLRRAINTQTTISSKAHGVHKTVESAVAARLRATTMHEASARLIVERNIVPTDGGFTWRTDRRVTMTSPLYLTESLVQAFLGDIVCPVLLVRAEQGILKDRASTDVRIGCVRDIEVVDIPGDHHVHMDDPQRVATALNSFLAYANS